MGLGCGTLEMILSPRGIASVRRPFQPLSPRFIGLVEESFGPLAARHGMRVVGTKRRASLEEVTFADDRCAVVFGLDLRDMDVDCRYGPSCSVTGEEVVGGPTSTGPNPWNRSLCARAAMCRRASRS